MRLKMLAGAAAVAALIATPAMATQQKLLGPQKQSAVSAGKNKKMTQTTTSRLKQDRLDSRASLDNQPRSGFPPLDFAAGVTAGALNTAGAIATAPFTPFRGDSYAYYRDPATGRGVIADDNGPKCLPGTVTTVNGRQMRCQ